MKKLRIAQVAPLWITVPPKKYGGIERIVSLLADGLAERGHDVTLFAPGTSKTKARLYPFIKKPLAQEFVSWNNQVWNLYEISKVVEMANQKKFDILHFHQDIWGLFFQNLTKTPVVHTMHNRLFLYKTEIDRFRHDRLSVFKLEAKNTNMVFISRIMKKLSRVRIPEKKTRIIHNSIELKDFKLHVKPQDHFVWIARMEKHKGIENAIEAAEKTGSKLKIAGRIDQTRREYFEKNIRPRLSDKIEYVGELNQKELSNFYGQAKAFLYPIEWEEPFGLVVAESQTCGTPVIAFRRGAMPELIDHGKTGFLVKDTKEMIEAMQKIDQIDRAAVRRAAEKRFSSERMVAEYERFYYDLIKKR